MSTALAGRLEGAAQALQVAERNVERAEEVFCIEHPGHPAKREVLWIAAEQRRAAAEVFKVSLIGLMRAG